MNGKQSALPTTLTVWNSGKGRSRIVVISHTAEPSDAWLNAMGSRWFFTSKAAAREFRNALQSNSYLRLRDEIPGGFSSRLWQQFRNDWQLKSAEFEQANKLRIARVGGNNSTVILIADDSESIAPQRIEPSLIVATNESAYNEFIHVARKLTNVQLKVMLGIGGGTINRIRKALRDQSPA